MPQRRNPLVRVLLRYGQTLATELHLCEENLVLDSENNREGLFGTLGTRIAEHSSKAGLSG
jgi:hypothetical protein